MTNQTPKSRPPWPRPREERSRAKTRPAGFPLWSSSRPEPPRRSACKCEQLDSRRGRFRRRGRSARAHDRASTRTAGAAICHRRASRGEPRERRRDRSDDSDEGPCRGQTAGCPAGEARRRDRRHRATSPTTVSSVRWASPLSTTRGGSHIGSYRPANVVVAGEGWKETPERFPWPHRWPSGEAATIHPYWKVPKAALP